MALGSVEGWGWGAVEGLVLSVAGFAGVSDGFAGAALGSAGGAGGVLGAGGVSEMETSSMSKMRSDFGGMTGGLPRSP